MCRCRAGFSFCRFRASAAPTVKLALLSFTCFECRTTTLLPRSYRLRGARCASYPAASGDKIRFEFQDLAHATIIPDYCVISLLNGSAENMSSQLMTERRLNAKKF